MHCDGKYTCHVYRDQQGRYLEDPLAIILWDRWWKQEPTLSSLCLCSDVFATKNAQMKAEQSVREIRDSILTCRENVWLVWKDTWKKCQSGDDGEAQTCPTDADGGADGTGPERYENLEDDVNDPRHKEEKGPHIMSRGHRCFLKAGSGKRHFLLHAVLHMTETCSRWRPEVPGRSRQRPSPNRKSTQALERPYSRVVPPHSYPRSSSPHTWSGRTPWPYLHVWTPITQHPHKSQECNLAFIYSKEETLAVTLSSADILEKPRVA